MENIEIQENMSMIEYKLFLMYREYATDWEICKLFLKIIVFVGKI